MTTEPARQTVFSFSVKRNDSHQQDIITKAKEYSEKTGITFSRIVTEGLALYLKDKTNG